MDNNQTEVLFLFKKYLSSLEKFGKKLWFILTHKLKLRLLANKFSTIFSNFPFLLINDQHFISNYNDHCP